MSESDVTLEKLTVIVLEDAFKGLKKMAGAAHGFQDLFVDTMQHVTKCTMSYIQVGSANSFSKSTITYALTSVLKAGMYDAFAQYNPDTTLDTYKKVHGIVAKYMKQRPFQDVDSDVVRIKMLYVETLTKYMCFFVEFLVNKVKEKVEHLHIDYIDANVFKYVRNDNGELFLKSDLMLDREITVEPASKAKFVPAPRKKITA